MKIPTQREYSEAASRDAYYRQALYQLGRTNADPADYSNQTDKKKTMAPPRSVPLAGVTLGNVSRSAKYKGAPTPKATAAQKEAERKHGDRVTEAVEAM